MAPRKPGKPTLPEAVLKGMDENLSILVLVRGPVAGKPHWAYARIPPSRYPAFLEAQGKGGYDLGLFASEILAQGEGAEPPPAVARDMREKGCNPAFEGELAQLLEEAARAAQKGGEK